jgi:hypothetical protein
MKLYEMLRRYGGDDGGPSQPDITSYFARHDFDAIASLAEQFDDDEMVAFLAGMGIMAEFIYRHGVPDDLAEVFPEPAARDA